LNNKLLIDHLKAQNPEDVGVIDRLKIAYRPLICPFDDLLAAIPEQSSVFDIGCGSGMFLSLVKAFRNPSKIGGIEISESLISNACAVLGDGVDEQTYLAVFNGKDLPSNISEYDYIFMIDVYHHIPPDQQKLFLTNLFSKMAPGSFLIFKDIEGASVLSYWNKVHDLLLSGEIGNEPKSKELLSFVAQHKDMELLRFNKRRMILYPHFTAVFKKKRL
jgi:2-polyprenyl-3-methyl-5-hydroxy-6-metoxy-1,4-benzoquinol methylase